MTPKQAKLRRRLAAIVAAPMLGGCADWAGPLLAGDRPVLRSRLPVHLYIRANGPACGPDMDTVRCDGAQYAVGRATLAALTPARYRGDDLLVQAISSRPQVKGIEYAVAREAAKDRKKGHWRSSSTGADASA